MSTLFEILAAVRPSRAVRRLPIVGDSKGGTWLRRRLAIAGALTLGFISAGAGPATAAQQLVLDASCDGVTYRLTTSVGRWSVVQSVDHDTHFITSAIAFAVRDANGNLIFEESDAKGGAHQNQSGQVTCLFSGEVVGPDGALFTIGGVAQGSLVEMRIHHMRPDLEAGDLSTDALPTRARRTPCALPSDPADASSSPF